MGFDVYDFTKNASFFVNYETYNIKKFEAARCKAYDELVEASYYK